jgi:hypothetical protein
MKVFIVQSSMGYGESQRIEGVFFDPFKAEVVRQRLERDALDSLCPFGNDIFWTEEEEVK